MERLTTDNPRDNVETSLNLFYIKGHETWVRGGGPEPEYADISLYDWARRIIQIHGLDIDTSDNDTLGDCLYERLFDCVDTMEGVVAHFYTAAWAFSELRARLAAYEDSGLTPDETPRAAELVKAEQDGRCVVLPCKINDIAWELYRRIGGEDSIRPIQFWWSDIPRLGKTVFLTYTEAEAVLVGGGDG